MQAPLLAPQRLRPPLAVAATVVLLGHAAVLLGPRTSHLELQRHTAATALRLLPARSAPAMNVSRKADEPAARTASSQAPAPAPLEKPAAPAFADPSQLDSPLVPRSAPDLNRLQGLRFSGLPIRLRLFIDSAGQVVQVRVLAAQEDDDTLSAVTGMFEATAFVPGRRAGVAVASFTDIELRLGGPEG